MFDRIFRGSDGGQAGRSRARGAVGERALAAPATAMTRWLRQGLQLGVCPLCRVAHKADREYVWHFSEEGLGSFEAVAALAAARGFCAQHAEMFEAIDRGSGSMLGVSSIYAELFADLDAELALLEVQRPLEVGRCPACAYRERAVESNARYLLGALAEPAGVIVRDYPGSAGLCFGHFAQVWAIGGQPQARAMLLDVQRRVTREILSDLRELIRKEGAEARREPRGAEQDAWRRAIALTAGWPPPRESAAVPERPGGGP